MSEVSIFSGGTRCLDLDLKIIVSVGHGNVGTVPFQLSEQVHNRLLNFIKKSVMHSNRLPLGSLEQHA